jgi:hypothetical protein
MYSLRRYAAPDISATLRNESLVLARACCPDLSAEYLTARFSTYGGIAAIFEEERLVAFELIDEFREGGERYASAMSTWVRSSRRSTRVSRCSARSWATCWPRPSPST